MEARVLLSDVPFGSPSVITTAADAARSVVSADIDGDGDLDAVSASILDGKIAWYENTAGDGSAWTARTIATAVGAVSVFAADVDGDGDLDALSASFGDDKIAWYENTAGDGSAWTPHTITTAADAAYSVFAADVDGDGDVDVLSASALDDKIAWYENTAGDGSAWTPRTISTAADKAISVFAADVDGDGDLDALSASYNDDKIAWYENTAGNGSAWTPRTIATTANGAFSVFAADIDGDGDLDALSASYLDDKVAWYENTAGDGSAWTPHTITTAANAATSVFAADVDGDGDLDALSASALDDKIAWYENTAGNGSAWTPRTITTTADAAFSVFAADVDGDGDVDVLSASVDDDKVAWYENLNQGGDETIGLFDPASGTFFLKNDNSAGAGDLVFRYGPAGAGWTPVTGDWDNNPTDTAGLFDPVASRFFLKNSNSAGAADLVFRFGPAGVGWTPLTGDWDGANGDSVGLFDSAAGKFFLKNSNSAGLAEVVFRYGPAGAGWLPVMGDWDGNGTDTPGLFDPANSTFFLKNANSAGAGDLVFRYGPAGAGWTPITGDWDGDGVDTAGLFDPASGTYYLKNANTAGPADLVFRYGPAGAGWTPIVGDWDADIAAAQAGFAAATVAASADDSSFLQELAASRLATADHESAATMSPSPSDRSISTPLPQSSQTSRQSDRSSKHDAILPESALDEASQNTSSENRELDVALSELALEWTISPSLDAIS